MSHSIRCNWTKVWNCEGLIKYLVCVISSSLWYAALALSRIVVVRSALNRQIRKLLSIEIFVLLTRTSPKSRPWTLSDKAVEAVQPKSAYRLATTKRAIHQSFYHWSSQHWHFPVKIAVLWAYWLVVLV